MANHSGLASPFQLTVNNFSFVPIQVASPRAAELVEKQRAKLASGKYPPGLRAAYEQQLALLANPNVPDFEIIFFPFTFPVPPPELDKPYLSIFPTLSRPFTRGTRINS